MPRGQKRFAVAFVLAGEFTARSSRRWARVNAARKGLNRRSHTAGPFPFFPSYVLAVASSRLVDNFTKFYLILFNVSEKIEFASLSGMP